jgi:hypothetical protein
MITISYGCTDYQCDDTHQWRSEITLSPETLFLVAMRSASDDGWTFNGNDPARALCPAHSNHRQGEVGLVRLFSRLHQVAGVHGLVMVGVEECLDGRLRVALAANTNPDPTNLVRFNDNHLRETLGMMQDAAHHVITANAAMLEKA